MFVSLRYKYFLLFSIIFCFTNNQDAISRNWSEYYDKKYRGILFDRNPIIQNKTYLLRLDVGVSIRGNGVERFRKVETNVADDGYYKSGYKYNLGHAMFAFSKPWKIHGVHGLMSLEAGGILGRRNGKVTQYNDDGSAVLVNRDYSEFNQYMGGVSFGPVIGWKYLFLAAEVGAYGKTESTSRIGSKFTFGEKISIGTNFNNLKIMVFYRHFSNAGLAGNNSGQNFIGISLGVALH